MSPRPGLRADRGAAAAADDFFRSSEFCAAEGVTHSLLIESPGGTLAAPVLVRDIPGTTLRGGSAERVGSDDGRALAGLPDGPLRDAISPYAYPGFTHRDGGTGVELADPERSSGPPRSDSPGSATTRSVDLDGLDWSATGLVTIFIRHSLGAPPPLTGATARNTVLISDPELPRKSRMSDRQQIRKNLRAGFEIGIKPGPETSPDERAAFLAAYTETMHRTNAAPRYFFDAAYFETILGSAATWLFLLREPGGEVAAASIATRSDGMLHYYLSGTADAHLRGAPMKNILAEMTDFAWNMGLPLNLGGGIKPGDPLEEFKRGFANREERLHTSEIICDPVAYRRLSANRATGDFFPAYRAPRP